jgi:hypothetical protein
MASAIGDLVARLRMDSTGFQKGSRSAIGSLGRLGSAATGFAKTAGLMAAGAVAAGAAIAVFGTRRQYAAIDATAKLSDQLGITTEKLLGLRHAAELTGAGAKGMDAGLATMAKRLGEAERGGGAAGAAIKELGLDAATLAGKSPDKAFYDIAEAMSAIEEPSKRNAIAANLFSKANMKLLNTLSLGKKGLADVQSEAERLGLTYGRDAARKVEAANDAMYRMKAAFGGIFQSLAISTAPLITDLANKLAGAIARIREPLFKTIEVFKVLGAVAWDAGQDIWAGIKAGAAVFAPLVEAGKNAFSVIVQNLDTMLGSWDGFKAGVVNLSYQAMYGVEAIWEQAKNSFAVMWEETARWWGNLWLNMQKTVTANMTPAFSRIAIELTKLQTKVRGGKWLLSGDEESAIIKSTTQQAVGGIDKRRSAAEEATNRRLATLRNEHQEKMAAIGAKAEAASARWKNQMGTMPKLSDKVNAAWAELNKGSDKGFAGGAAGDAAGMSPSTGGPKFSGAHTKGSAEAYSLIVQAGRGGDQIAKSHLQVGKQQLTVLRQVERKLNTSTVSIPS